MLWQDFDLDGKLRVPIGYNLAVLYMLRGYIFWVVSLTFSDDRSLILSLVYPNLSMFWLTLVVGLPALITFFFFSLKSQISKSWYQWVWARLRLILTISMAVDLMLQAWIIVTQTLDLHPIQMIQFILGSYLFWYWLRSKRIQRFFKQWLQQAN